MTISYNTFTNGTEVDLTNQFHNQPCLALSLNTLTNQFIISNYKTNEIKNVFVSIVDAVAHCNVQFDCVFTLEDGSMPGQ